MRKEFIPTYSSRNIFLEKTLWVFLGGVERDRVRIRELDSVTFCLLKEYLNKRRHFWGDLDKRVEFDFFIVDIV